MTTPSADGGPTPARARAAEVLTGLRNASKRISPKYFYDQRGSELFDAIRELPEYYLTRVERAIMDRHLPEIAALVGPKASVIEFGAGSNDKVRRLLAVLEAPAAYVPVEISAEYLAVQVEELATDFPELSISPVIADFTRPFELPVHSTAPERNLVFFPGSTIGNFSRSEARGLLKVMCEEARAGGALLIGVDLVKDPRIVRAAYNDSRGLTAEFNRNVLHHLNNSFGADFEPENFDHEAMYDEAEQRIEMRLIAQCSHTVEIAGETVRFVAGEPIVTEHSHKYSIDGFKELARTAGWDPLAVWTDPDDFFSVHFLTVR